MLSASDFPLDMPGDRKYNSTKLTIQSSSLGWIEVMEGVRGLGNVPFPAIAILPTCVSMRST